jgi:hypothetical protein
VRDHKMSLLFDGVAATDKAAIQEHVNKSLAAHPEYQEFLDGGVSFDIESIAQRTEDMFLRARYWHELIMPSKDSHGFAGNPGLGVLCDGFRDFFVSMNPNWLERLDAFHILPLKPEKKPPPTSPAH